MPPRPDTGFRKVVTPMHRFVILSAALIILAGLGSGACTGTRPGVRPQLLVNETRSGMGQPFGESGRGPVLYLPRTASNPRYGWTPRRPVGLGGFGAVVPEPTAQERQIRYLNSLWGPDGQTIFYEHIGTCCPFTSFGAPLDRGVINVYALRWDGLEEPRHLYLDGFREGDVSIPRGLTSKIPPP